MKKILLVWLGLFVTLCAFESAVIVVVKISGAGRGALQPRGYARNPFNHARAGLTGTRSNAFIAQIERPAGFTQRAGHAIQSSILRRTWNQRSTATGLQTASASSLQPVFKI